MEVWYWDLSGSEAVGEIRWVTWEPWSCDSPCLGWGGGSVWGRWTVYEGAYQKMPVNGWNETRCPSYIPSSLRYALTRSLSLPGSQMAVKKMQSRGVLACTSYSLISMFRTYTAKSGLPQQSPVTHYNIFASHWIFWGTPCCTNDVFWFPVYCMNFPEAAKWLAFLYDSSASWGLTKDLD